MINNLFEILEIAITFDRMLLCLMMLLAVIFLKNSKRINCIGLFSGIGIIIILLLGILGLMTYLFGENSIHRGFIIVPVGILSISVMTRLISRIEDKKQKILVIIIAVIILATSGDFIFKEANVYEASNKDNVYDTAVEIADIVTSKKENPYIAISNLQGVFIRQYNANIRLVGVNVDMSKWYEDDIIENVNYVKNEIIQLIQQNNPDMDTLLSDAKKLDCDYVICLDSQLGEFDYESAGFTCDNVVDGFYVLENQR